jgi:hypothetical protein
MFEDILQHRAAVAENIQKAFTGNELEKAHKVGDVHPNGKWVWTQLPSGKYDWRVIKKTGAGSGSGTPSTAQKKKEDHITISPNHPALGALKGVNAMKDYLTTFNSKYTDMSKVEVMRTPKGNWDVHYDGHRLGIFAGDQVPEGTAKKMGWLRTDSKDLTRSKRDAEEEAKKSVKKAKVPSGHHIQYDDDLVEVYDDKGKKVYSGLLDYCDYKYENYKWNETDKNYDLPHGYKMVGKTKH